MRIEMAGDFRRKSTEALDKALSAERPAERTSLIDQAVFWHERAEEAEDAERKAAAEPRTLPEVSAHGSARPDRRRAT